MLATVVTFAAIQFRPAGFLLSWDGSLNGPTMVALRIPVIRDSIRQLVLHADVSLALLYAFLAVRLLQTTRPVLALNIFCPSVEPNRF